MSITGDKGRHGPGPTASFTTIAGGMNRENLAAMFRTRGTLSEPLATLDTAIFWPTR
jgi:hypothetical protein